MPKFYSGFCMRKILTNLTLSLILILLPLSAGAVTAMVEVRGRDVGHLVGEKVKDLQVYAGNSQGDLQPIAFQIDEKVGSGNLGTRDWNWQGGEGKKKAGAPDGIFNSDEVLYFLRSQAGPPVDLEKIAFAKKAMEIFLDKSGQRRVYLVSEKNPPAQRAKPLVQYDPTTDQVSSPYYQMGFSAKRPIIQNRLIIKNSQNPKDILDRFKIRFKLAIKRFFDIKFTENDIKSRVVGYRGGPLRVVRRLEAWKSLGPVKLIPRSQIEFVFYSDWVEVTTEIKNPVDGPKVLDKDTKGVSGFDFNNEVVGSRLYTNLLTGADRPS